MKIQIDTTSKTIKLEENVKLSALVETLDKFFPNQEWKEFTLETNTTISYWSNPVIIREYPRPYYTPWYGTEKVYMSSADRNSNYSLKAGIYNVEVEDKLLM